QADRVEVAGEPARELVGVARRAGGTLRALAPDGSRRETHFRTQRRRGGGERIALLYGIRVAARDRKSTRLNSSHVKISYAVFCAPPALPSFPTRRSSDLQADRVEVAGEPARELVGVARRAGGTLRALAPDGSRRETHFRTQRRRGGGERIALLYGIRVAARQELVQDDPDAVVVRRHACGLAAPLLRRRVPGREDVRAGRRQRRVALGVLQQLGDAEVEQLHAAIARDEHVRGLDVAVHHEVAVREGDGVAHVEEEAQPGLDAEAPPVAPGVDRLALDVLHDEVRRLVAGHAGIQQPRDAIVLEAGEHALLLPEAREADGVAERAAHDLERDRVPQVLPHRAVDRAHAAPDDHLGDAVGADHPTAE